MCVPQIVSPGSGYCKAGNGEKSKQSRHQWWANKRIADQLQRWQVKVYLWLLLGYSACFLLITPFWYKRWSTLCCNPSSRQSMLTIAWWVCMCVCVFVHRLAPFADLWRACAAARGCHGMSHPPPLHTSQSSLVSIDWLACQLPAS